MTTNTAVQHTLGRAVNATGVGLFTAQRTTITLHPAMASSGLVFRRSDLPGSPEMPARIALAIDTPRRTTLASGEQRIETTEHVLSALAGMGIDNAVIELNAMEPPMFDGSAARYVEMIADAGTQAQAEQQRVFQVREAFTIDENGAMIQVMPGADDALELAYSFDGGSDWPEATRFQTVHMVLTPEHYAKDIAPARTFSLLAQAQAARAAGLFQHVTPKDMLVIGPDGPVDNALRFSDEPARHKLLDLLGDLALAGVTVRGQIHATRSGHNLNRALAKEIARRANGNT